MLQNFLYCLQFHHLQKVNRLKLEDPVKCVPSVKTVHFFVLELLMKTLAITPSTLWIIRIKMKGKFWFKIIHIFNFLSNLYYEKKTIGQNLSALIV